MKSTQQAVHQWIQTYGIRYFNEMTNLAILTEEVGELSRYISRVYGEQSFKSTEDELNAHAKIKEELSDILFVVCCLANQMDIDLESAMQDNFDKKTSRDHSRHHQNIKLKN